MYCFGYQGSHVENVDLTPLLSLLFLCQLYWGPNLVLQIFQKKTLLTTEPLCMSVVSASEIIIQGIDMGLDSVFIHDVFETQNKLKKNHHICYC